MGVERRWPKGVYVRDLPSVEGHIYSQVTSATPRRTIHVAGTLPFDEHQVLVGENDVRAQTRCVLEHIAGRSRSSARSRATSCGRRRTSST